MNQRKLALAVLVSAAAAAGASYYIVSYQLLLRRQEPPINLLLTQRNMTIQSPVFLNDQNIPLKYTCDGQGINPPLEFSGVPEQARSLALIMHDPDAPVAGGFTHWVIYNISPMTALIPENTSPAGASLGQNGAGKTGYTGPCPPSGTHHYFFKVYALDTQLQIGNPPTKDELERAMQGHILAQARLVGLYARN